MKTDPRGRAARRRWTRPKTFGDQPWLFRLSGLADLAHRAIYTSRTPGSMNVGSTSVDRRTCLAGRSHSWMLSPGPPVGKLT